MSALSTAQLLKLWNQIWHCLLFRFAFHMVIAIYLSNYQKHRITNIWHHLERITYNLIEETVKNLGLVVCDIQWILNITLLPSKTEKLLRHPKMTWLTLGTAGSYPLHVLIVTKGKVRIPKEDRNVYKEYLQTTTKFPLDIRVIDYSPAC